MLTPDQGFLDRRIAQEANSLAARGWLVDIYPAYLPLHPPPEMLAPGVQMLERPPQPRSSGARRFKHLLRDYAPSLHRFADAAQTLVTDRAELIADWNEAYLAGHGPYEVVFAHDLPVLPLASRLRANHGGALVCDLHEIFPEMVTTASAVVTRRYWRRVEDRYLGEADGLMAANRAIARYTEERGFRQVPVNVVHNAVPFVADPRAQGIDIRDVYGLARDRRVLVFAGSLVADTNVEVLVRGFAESGLDGWDLVLLGSGPLLDHLQGVVAAIRAGDRVHLGQRVDQHLLIGTLASADAAALPYIGVDFNHQISTPNKLFEYTQARVPIAASRLPEIERILVEHGNGGFVDYTSPAAVAAGLRRFLSEDLAGFASATLEAAAARLSWEAEEPALLATLEGALVRQSVR